MRIGVPATWEHRGYTYRITRIFFVNNEPGTSSEIIKSPNGKRNGADPWMYCITKTGQGKNFWEAVEGFLQSGRSRSRRLVIINLVSQLFFNNWLFVSLKHKC